MIVLGIDPGSDRMGYAFVESDKGKQELISVGCITTTRGATDEGRLIELFDALTSLLIQYAPDIAAIESLFFANNAKTIIQVGQARGVILLACAKSSIPVQSYAPLEVKMAITGYGKAEKKQVQHMIQSILKLKDIPKPDDAADAVAIALTHCFSHKIKQFRI